MARLTSRDEHGNAEIIALEDITPQLYEGLSFSETNALTVALNKLADYEDADEKENEGREKPCDGCKFDVARKLLSKVVDDRFTEEMREFLLLVLENPELPVVPMVYSECVGGDEYSYWLSKVGRSEIREFAIDEWYHDGAIVYRDEANAEETLIEAIAEVKYNGTDGDYKRAKKEVSNMWTKAIVVYITEFGS